MSQRNIHSEQGFTAVELLITITVSAMFAIAFYQLFTSVNQSSSAARNRATANDIAYNNLRRYASAGIEPSDWSPAFDCDESAGTANVNDVTIYSNAPGTVLMSGSLTSSSANLPGPITYSVKALAIFGCNTSNTGKPIRVESQVTYGPRNTVIKHATLVGY